MPVAQQEHQTSSVLRHRLAEARTNTDALFAVVRPEFFYERPIAERHRILFYIGHLEAFDWNLLGERAFGLKSFHPEFDKLFAFGIDPVGGGLPTDQPSDWPALGEVRGYVTRVRDSLDSAGDRFFSRTNGDGDSGAMLQLLNVAVEHRLMHAETLTYMLHRLPLDQKIAGAVSSDVSSAGFQPRVIDIPAGRATLGRRSDQPGFGWDNEFEENAVEVPGFAIDKYKVTNGEFLKFVNAGGYQERAIWSDADWQWITKEGITHPAFWNRGGEGWRVRTMFGEVPLPLTWPVYVSQAEAQAYARWAGKQLPTEAQWHRAAFGTSTASERAYPWSSTGLSANCGNFDFQRWDPTPVHRFPAGQSAFGVCDLVGNGWEWTCTQFAPFPGFEAFSFYRGYSADFFDGKHYVIKGGSARTAACMLRRSFRNWFQPHYPYVYAGFRCVSN